MQKPRAKGPVLVATSKPSRLCIDLFVASVFLFFFSSLARSLPVLFGMHVMPESTFCHVKAPHASLLVKSVRGWFKQNSYSKHSACSLGVGTPLKFVSWEGRRCPSYNNCFALANLLHCLQAILPDSSLSSFSATTCAVCLNTGLCDKGAFSCLQYFSHISAQWNHSSRLHVAFAGCDALSTAWSVFQACKTSRVKISLGTACIQGKMATCTSECGCAVLLGRSFKDMRAS